MKKFDLMAMSATGMLGGLAAMAFAVLSVSCGGTAIEGTWLEPVPSMPSESQGVTLEKGGRAESVNMATLRYETWSRHGDKLVLSGKSIGNGVTLSFSDTLTVEKLDAENLVLSRGGMTVKYRRAE